MIQLLLGMSIVGVLGYPMNILALEPETPNHKASTQAEVDQPHRVVIR